MLFKKPTDIPSSEITPEGLYLNRRKFIAGLGALAGVSVAARFASRVGTAIAIGAGRHKAAI